MNSADTQLEKDLARLGQLMSPDRSFAHRVMEQIDPLPRKTIPDLKRRWLMPIGLSLAASFMLALGSIAILHHASTLEAGPDDQAAHLVRTSTEWQTVSERAITLDGEVPAREISQQKFERVRWFDPRLHTTFERVVPREKCTFVTLVSY